MADGNRRIARALYDRANQSEKTKVSEFFENLGPKRDGKISLGEIKRGVVSKKIVLEELDSNSDGFLDFNDVLLLFYYVEKAITILRCHGCSKLIFGPSYSCFECLFDVADKRFALCRDCYGKGSVKHPHLLTSTSTATATAADLRDQALLLKFNDLIVPNHKTSPPKKDLEILWKKAKNQVRDASPALETMADNYFKSMGSDNHLDLKNFSDLTKKAFLTTSPDSDPATNFMKNALATKLGYNGPQTTPTEIHEAHSYTASPSTLQTHSGDSSTHPPNLNTSSNGISPLKVATTTFKIVEMALTIASLSSLCTIM